LISSVIGRIILKASWGYKVTEVILYG